MHISTNGKLEVVNSFGELERARVKRCESYGIRHETVGGDWVRKIDAIREGVQLTGQRKRVHVSTANRVVAR